MAADKLTLISPDGMVKAALRARTHHPVDLVHACLERAALGVTAATVEGSYLAVTAVIDYLAAARPQPGATDTAAALGHVRLDGWGWDSVDIAYGLVPRILTWVARPTT